MIPVKSPEDQADADRKNYKCELQNLDESDYWDQLNARMEEPE